MCVCLRLIVGYTVLIRLACVFVYIHVERESVCVCACASSSGTHGRERIIPQIGQGSTHVAHHVMLKQQSFKRGGRGRSQIVETSLRQGSKIDRREGGGGERRARLGKGVRGKRRVFSKQCRCLHVEFLAWYLPSPYLPQGIWSRAPFASEKEQYSSSIITCGSPARWL